MLEILFVAIQDDGETVVKRDVLNDFVTQGIGEAYKLIYTVVI
jgi:hypothetical protein